MSKIAIMDKALANQIAAGEVVERPASVVKELVENAIDAGSQQIIVELVEAGVQKIQVTDDGEGMSMEDLFLSFQPHATSKIHDKNDLFQIKSLGFRGEALASITSVAKVRIESKLLDESTGHFIEVHGSDLVESGESKARQGTSVRVESIFYNTPARLKHLKSLTTELKHSLVFIQNIALAHPEIKFTLINDGNVIFQSVGNGQTIQAVASVYQAKTARELMKLAIEDTDFNIQGFISPPTLTRTNYNYIHWIINGRTVKSRMLSEVLVKAYGRQLMVGRYPIAVIHISLDPRLVDVNVHPTKQIVRLSKEEELAALLRKGVDQALDAANPIPNITNDDLQNHQAPVQNSRDRESDGLEKPDAKTHNDHLAFQSPEPDNSWIEDSDSLTYHQDRFDSLPSAQAPIRVEDHRTKPKNDQMMLPDFNHLHYIGQLHGTYLIAENEKGFYLIDQHAAQEKIRYETFMATPIENLSNQQLLLPLIVDFPTDIVLEIEQSLEKLQAWGIYLEPFGPNSYQLESYPIWMEDDDLEKSIKDTCEYILKHPTASLNEVLEASLVMKSCKGAIKANHHLSDQEAHHLIQALSELKDPYHCPHGRPVMVQISTNTIEKWFKRIQDPHHRHHFDEEI